MPRSRVEESYRSLYVEQRLERAGLFAALARVRRFDAVLYPGCSIHVTPSFFFPRVVYVDASDAAARFFGQPSDVLSFVRHERRYAEEPHVEFLHADFFDLPFEPASFDLLLSLWAPGIGRACGRFVRPGGYLLSNDHHDDAGEAARSGEWALAATIEERGGAFRVDDADLDAYFVARERTGVRRAPGQPRPRWPEYEKTAPYYLFRRTG